MDFGNKIWFRPLFHPHFIAYEVFSLQVPQKFLLDIKL